MNIHIQRRPHSIGEYEVIAFDQMGQQTRVYTLGDDGRLVGHDIDQGTTIPEDLVLMRVHRDFFEALAKAASEHVPVSEATGEHLRDAVTVRDRLLTLVEKAVERNV